MNESMGGNGNDQFHVDADDDMDDVWANVDAR
jgi:hypothetical protein